MWCVPDLSFQKVEGMDLLCIFMCLTIHTTYTAPLTPSTVYTVQPVLSLLPEMKVSVRANENISITCVANVSVPPSTFHWVINGAVVNQSGKDYCRFMHNFFLFSLLSCRSLIVCIGSWEPLQSLNEKCLLAYRYVTLFVLIDISPGINN